MIVSSRLTPEAASVKTGRTESLNEAS